MAAKKNPRAADVLAKDDLIVIGGAGGFIGGALALLFTIRASPGFARSTRSRCPSGISACRASSACAWTSATRRTAGGPCEGAVEVYNLAADMGGMGFIERFRIECLRSILINTHMIEAAYRAGARRYFFSSSACAYNTAAARPRTCGR